MKQAGQRGLDHGRLVVSLDIKHTPHSEPNRVAHPRVVHFSGTVFEASRNLHLADLTRSTLAWYPGRSDDTVYLYFSLTNRVLDLLQEARRTGRDDVRLELKLTADLDGAKWEQLTGDMPCVIAASDWLRMLEGFGHSTMTSIEVPVRGAWMPPVLTNAAAAYEHALAKITLCDWDGAIADSRQVFDHLFDVLQATEPNVPWAEFAQPDVRQAWTFVQRLATMRMIARNATHTAHHGERNRSPEEARYVVAQAGLALRLYAERLRA